MKYLLIVLSMPFFVAGFAGSFIRQAWDDGVKFEQALREYFDSL